MERVRRMLSEQDVQWERTKCNEVHHIEWDNGAGEQGSAWVQTRGQLHQIVTILKEKPGMKVVVEGYLVPRDRAMLTKWLNQYGLQLPKPVSSQTYYPLDEQ